MEESKQAFTSTPGKLHVDFDAIQDVGLKGVRRAAAFLAIGYHATEGQLPESLSLDSHSQWRFFPDPLPEGFVAEATAEFRLWIVGNALRELDSAFSRFLDFAWGALQYLKLHGTVVPTSYKIRDISSETSAAKKFRMVMEDLGSPAEEDASRLWLLSNARNCLVHSAGIVTERHAIDGVLKLRWLALEARIQQGNTYIVLSPSIPHEGLSAPNPDEPAEVLVCVVEREKDFVLDQVIVLTPNDLTELCFNYQRLVETVLAAFKLFAEEKGIPVTDRAGGASN